MAVPTNFHEIGKAFIESYMIDECMITRDLPGLSDDTFDENTLELVRSDGDETLIYSGKCLVRAIGTKEMSYEDGDLPVFRKVYTLQIPKDSDHIEIGDTVKVLVSPQDETLEGREFRVMENRFSTHLTYRFMRIEDVQQDYNPTNPMT
jgi:hypothetical protein